jgi:hypothetical protein
MAGVKRSLLVAVLSPVIGSLYQYFSVTYMPVGDDGGIRFPDDRACDRGCRGGRDV